MYVPSIPEEEVIAELAGVTLLRYFTTSKDHCVIT